MTRLTDLALRHATLLIFALVLLWFGLQTPGFLAPESLANIVKQAASQAIVTHRGTISHQHGVGRDHAAWLGVEKGELGMATLRALSAHFDPEQRLAPGVLIERP